MTSCNFFHQTTLCIIANGLPMLGGVAGPSALLVKEEVKDLAGPLWLPSELYSKAAPCEPEERSLQLSI